MTNATNLVAKWESKTSVTLRVGGNGAEHVGQVVPARSKSGSTKYVRLVSLVEDYGSGDVAEFAVEFVS